MILYSVSVVWFMYVMPHTFLYLVPAATGSSDVTLGYHGYTNKWSSPDPVTLTIGTGKQTLTTECSSVVTVAVSDASSPTVQVSYCKLVYRTSYL